MKFRAVSDILRKNEARSPAVPRRRPSGLRGLDRRHSRGLQAAGGATREGIAAKEMHGQYGTDVVIYIGSRDEEETSARNLSAVLREFDDEEVMRI